MDASAAVLSTERRKERERERASFVVSDRQHQLCAVLCSTVYEESEKAFSIRPL